MPNTQDNKYDAPIRSVERTIGVLQAINRNGAMTMSEISRAVQIPYPTATRFVQTLIKIGVIEKSKTQKKYKPTALSKTLSCGYQASDHMAEIARPFLTKLTKKTGWPSAVHVRVGASMVMLDSTHSATTQTFSDYYPGYSMPITSCAAGLAFLAHIDDETQTEILDQITKYGDTYGNNAFLHHQHPELFKSIQGNGYATYVKNPHSKDPGKSSSIGVPLKVNGRTVGAMTLVFFSSAMKMNQAIEDYIDAIYETQSLISEGFTKESLFIG